MAVATIAAPAVFATPEADVRRRLAGATQILMGLVTLFAFGLGTRTAHGASTTFGMTLISKQGTHVPDWVFPARPVIVALALVCVLLGAARLAVELPRRGRLLATSAVLFCFTFAFMAWSAADPKGAERLIVPSLLDSMVIAATPLVLGALGGVVGERSGVVNVAIEGQLLFGGFMTALVGSATHNLFIGAIAGVLAGALMGLLLAVLAIRYLIEQVVLGVVLNLLALGVTGFLYKSLMQTNQSSYNSVTPFSSIRIPGLASIWVIGPVLFDQPLIIYLTVFLVVLVHLGLFRTRWGLRTRAVGEHPAAADTVGIKVLRLRYRNVVLGGAFAGLGGAWLVGNVGNFTESMTNGKGFIALAAVIFGRWSPFGALAAAALFGFTDALASQTSSLQLPIPSDLLSTLPYVATLFAVAGLIGRVRAPAADGKPYVKG
ncbi:MAG: ABC transporter permease [Catenulispora sp. 13_1_20CM_3_70_7]|jgi:general nucleoside transport system permease protein|nr:MAG: ABC transporter permease [Catenulispora sp. 13_1_20CM_3_70_7]